MSFAVSKGQFAHAGFSKMGLLLIFTFLIFVPLAIFGQQDFIAGADMSHLGFFEMQGVVYRENGVPGDALEIVKSRGLNCVRLRIFTSSSQQAAADPYNYINNLDYTLPLAQRVKRKNLKLLLDFHYSDTWADPQHQTTPSAWTNLTFPELCQALRTYTSNVLQQLKAADAAPDYVQIGNEITAGMLWPEGKVGGTNDTPQQWQKLAALLNHGIQGVKDAFPTNPPKIIIHIDRGGDWAGAKWFFENLQRYRIQFDIIGYSYYPWWHGPLSNLVICASNTSKTFSKPIMIVETAFPWTYSTNIYGIPATTNGQVQYVINLAMAIHSIPGRPVCGILWWGAEYQNLPGYQLAGFQYKSFWNTNGNVLPVVDALGALRKPIRISIIPQSNAMILEWPISGVGLVPSVSRTINGSDWSPLYNSQPQLDGLICRFVWPLDNTETSCFLRLHAP